MQSGIAFMSAMNSEVMCRRVIQEGDVATLVTLSFLPEGAGFSDIKMSSYVKTMLGTLGIMTAEKTFELK
jgi:hypothetical protein